MKLAFLDPVRAYPADAPYQGPVGGTQSAVCYLTEQLARRGHHVALYNHIEQTTTAPAERGGVTAKHWSALMEGGDMALYDAVVVVGRWTADIIAGIKQAGKPVWGWMQEATWQTPWIAPSPHFNGVVFISEWQRKVNKLALPATVDTPILRNAMSPRFAALGEDPAALLAQKQSGPPTAVYVGDTPRGLMNLLGVWPAIHAACPEVKLELYCNPTRKNEAEDDKLFADEIRAIPGVAHVGGVPQPVLAERLARARYLLAPNPYPETSCIALIEAIAAGLDCVVAARAALPETAGGHCCLIACEDAENPYQRSVPVDMEAFTRTAIAMIQSTPDTARLTKQIESQHQTYTWAKRAEEWEAYLGSQLV